VLLDGLWRDVAVIVAEKCVDPATKRPLTAALVERGMKEVHYSVNPKRSAKQQALDVIRMLREKGSIPIERAQMRLRIAVDGLAALDTPVAALLEEISPLILSKEHEEQGPPFILVC